MFTGNGFKLHMLLLLAIGSLAAVVLYMRIVSSYADNLSIHREAPIALVDDPFPLVHRMEAMTRFPVQVTIQNRLQRFQKVAVVQGGFPLAKGMVKDLKELELIDSDGERIPFQRRSLSYWSDGSTKWVELTFYIFQLKAAEKKVLSLCLRDDEGRADETALQPVFPDSLIFELEDSKGKSIFSVDQSSVVYSGVICKEFVFNGHFKGRKNQTVGAISVTRFPALKAVRYKVELKQLSNGDTWKELKVLLPHPYIKVHREKEMGAGVQRIEPNLCRVTLIKRGTEPADRGVGRRWEIWGYENPELFQDRPIRPQFSPEYLRATNALGRFVINPPELWEISFESSFERVFAKRDANPKNMGWRHFGSFFDREHGLAYYGYLDQEYDPATALILAYARTGKADYLNKAEDLADFFRDMCVSPDGGVYHHRATLRAAEAHVIAILTEGLLNKMENQPAYKPSLNGLVAALTVLYGEKYPDVGRDAKRFLETVKALPFGEQRALLAQRLVAGLLEEVKNGLRKRMAGISQKEEAKLTIKWLFEIYASNEEINELGFKDADRDFDPFFKRYGGSWEDFPGFHVDFHPDPEARHSGGHSLVEMLVLTYFFTGDEGLRETALKVAHHHLNNLAPQEIAKNKKIVAGNYPIFSRDISWPLINLISLWNLTEHRNQELNRSIKEMAQRLAYQLIKNPIRRCEGSIGSGTGMEALARYHEKTGDENVARSLVRWARYWAATQWNSQAKAFPYRHNQSEPAWKSMTALNLYGLAYAHNLSPDEKLKQRVLEARDSILDEVNSYAKVFAMNYRSTPRALEIIDNWEDLTGKKK